MSVGNAKGVVTQFAKLSVFWIMVALEEYTLIHVAQPKHLGHKDQWPSCEARGGGGGGGGGA